MSSLPAQLRHIGVPPVKCQGIKTRLIPFIASQIQWPATPEAVWIEPFLGSGVVAFNVLPQRALLADSNHHIIRFYRAIQQHTINRETVRQFLTHEGHKLKQQGEPYYYEVRERFNQTGDSLDFLFLNRACFNGLMRFNRKGRFNVPFCRKPQRFSQSYVTKIANQVAWVAQQMAGKDWEFCALPWAETLKAAKSADFVYLDPPYIGRHTDYFNAWDQAEAEALATRSQGLPCGFAVSMWLENQYRHNGHVQQCWSGLEQRVCQHFYHVGSKESWRGAIAEALLIKPGYAACLEAETAICPV